jgi:hypothetical protein
MYKVPNGPTAYFDVDDTLISWNMEDGHSSSDYVVIECRGRSDEYLVNRHNLMHLMKLSTRGHGIIVWSAGGSDWAEAVVKALNIEEYVDVVAPKPTYYIDDVKDPARILGKYAFYNIDGKRHGYAPKEDEEN